jgi:hypothetical protein
MSVEIAPNGRDFSRHALDFVLVQIAEDGRRPLLAEHHQSDGRLAGAADRRWVPH